MAKVKIMKKELVWDVFNTGDGSKIGVAKGDVWCAVLDEELSKKMYSIVSVYYDYTYKEFCEQVRSFIAFVGKYDFCDYYSVRELKAAYDCICQDVFFYAVARNEWNMVEVEADYFSIQGTDGYDRPFTKATFQDYDSAIKYCRENNMDINNIVPQKWGTYVPLFD